MRRLNKNLGNLPCEAIYERYDLTDSKIMLPQRYKLEFVATISLRKSLHQLFIRNLPQGKFF